MPFYSDPNANDTRKALYPYELSDDLKAEFEHGYKGEATPELDELIR